MSPAAVASILGSVPQNTRNPLVRRLSAFADLESAELSLLNGLLADVRLTRVKRDIIREGSRTDYVHLIIDGWAARYRVLADGARQITSFLLPGDFCDLDVTVLGQLDHGVVALTPCRVAWIGLDRFNRLTAEHPLIARHLWRAALLDETILRAWVVSLGRRDAYQRVAHLLCELHYRALTVGLVANDRFDLPLTQNEIADAVGLTAVHVNRTVQRLRTDGLIELSSRVLTIKDVCALQQAAGFDPSYLHNQKP